MMGAGTALVDLSEVLGGGYTVWPRRPDMKLSSHPMAAMTRRTTPTHSNQFRACEKPPTRRRTIATTPAMIRSVFMVSTFLSAGIFDEPPIPEYAFLVTSI
jgi:hypothetical protein